MSTLFALFGEAWRWWLREFLALLPERHLGKVLPARRYVLLRARASETELSVLKGGAAEWAQNIPHPAAGGEAQELQAAFDARYGDLARLPIALLPREAVLRTALHLPQAAARHLNEAASYQIERLSPFPPANTLYAIGASKEDGSSGEIAASLLIAAKDFVEDIEARAGALGFSGVAFAVETGGPASFERIAFAGRQAKPAAMPLSVRALLAAAALLAATLGLAPIVSKTIALASAGDEAQKLKPQAGEAAKLRGTRDRQLSLLTKATALRHAALAPLAILTKLTTALDDASFLTELRLEGTALTLSGLSSDAPALAQKLGAMPEFKAVKFSGPVTREPQTSRDRFTLQLELTPPP